MTVDELDAAVNHAVNHISLLRPDVAFPIVEFNTIGEDLIEVRLTVKLLPLEVSRNEI